MGTRLTVILGAGASADVIPPHSASSIKEPNYRPPLTKEIFQPGRYPEGLINKFNGVAQCIGEIRRIISFNTSTVPESLESFLEKLKFSEEYYKRAQFRHFAPFLQNYFGVISNEYCFDPVNYNELLNKTLLGKIEKVAYLTLNYDLLFDKALNLHHGTKNDFLLDPENMKRYIPEGGKWMYIKLHGSVDWGRRMKADLEDISPTLEAWLDKIDKTGDNLDRLLNDEIVYDPLFTNPHKTKLLYPAISVPVKNESKMSCRKEHLSALRAHLDLCQNFLIIGYSGIDVDVLDLLAKKKGGFGKVLVISKDKEQSSEVIGRIMSYQDLGQKLQTHIEPYDGYGFSEFLYSKKMDSFIQGLL